MSNQQLDPELINRKWRHRRLIAYISLWAVIAETAIIVLLAVLGLAGNLAEFNSILMMVLTGQLGLVGAYMGLSTWQESQN